MQLTRKLLASLPWTTAFEADGFKVLTARGLDDFAIIHEKRPTGRTAIKYRAAGRFFDNPAEAVRYYNEIDKEGAAGGSRRPGTAGSAKPATAREGALPGRRDVRP